MTKLEPIAQSPRGLYEAIFAPVKAELILAAIKAELFKHLEKPTSPEALAGRQGWEPRAAAILLDGLASCGLLRKEDGLFVNTPEASRFLIPGGPAYLGSHLLATHGMVTGGLAGLAERLQGTPAPQAAPPDARGETDWAAMAEGMANSARAGRALFALGLVEALPEFATLSKMLDLGGGPGMHCIAMVQAHPSMTGVVFDCPDMEEPARGYIEEYGLGGRIDFLGGDYMSDSIGEGYDLIWASAALNFCGDDLGGLMAKLHKALNPGGVLAVLQEGLTHEGTRPAEMVLPMLSWRLMSDEGINFAQGEIAAAMLEAGFRSVRSRSVDTVHGVMDLDVARK